MGAPPLRLRTEARSFFHAKLGRIPSDNTVWALARELEAAEKRGRDAERVVILDAVARHAGTKLANAIAAQLAQPASITPRDGLAQTAEDVADEHGRTAAPAEG